MSGPEEQGPPTPPTPPSEDELRAAYEAELARITAVDMIAQSAVSLLNIGARRLGPPGASAEDAAAAGRDLEQARDAIDAARAMLEILERRIPGELGPLKDALSRLQMAYAQEIAGPGGAPAAGAGPGEQTSGAEQPGAEQPRSPAGEPSQDPAQKGPGPAESSGRLWVPGR
ncbi:MAG TPA: hypothetical protein VN618_09610 [Solirubrobacteraceae bacterium]|nr:hypothetical protein [Solirubrobacteraceae bacterium]